MSNGLIISPIHRLPLLKQGDDLAAMIVSRANEIGLGVRNRDVIVVGQKAVSKAEGRIVNLDDITPSHRAIALAKKTGKRPEFVQVVLKDSARILRASGDAFIVTTKNGQTCMNGGVDKSNVKGDSTYALLPENPDA